MKREELLEYIGNVDDRYIEELFEDAQVLKKSSGHRRRGLRAIAACLAVLIIAGSVVLGFGLNIGNISIDVSDHTLKIGKANNSVIMLDVNPSISITVNDRNEVVSISAKNQDAKKIVMDVNVVGKNYDEALKLVVKDLSDNKYLTMHKNSILISVMNPDEKKANDLREKVVSLIDSYEKELHYKLSILSQVMTSDKDVKKQADKYEVSSGKLMLISKLCDQSKKENEFKVEELITSSVQILDQLLEYVGTPEDVKRDGKTSVIVSKESFKKADVSEDDGSDLLSFLRFINDSIEQFADLGNSADKDKKAASDKDTKAQTGKSKNGKDTNEGLGIFKRVDEDNRIFWDVFFNLDD